MIKFKIIKINKDINKEIIKKENIFYTIILNVNYIIEITKRKSNSPINKSIYKSLGAFCNATINLEIIDNINFYFLNEEYSNECLLKNTKK